jgi:hypothetical protein
LQTKATKKPVGRFFEEETEAGFSLLFGKQLETHRHSHNNSDKHIQNNY